MRLLCLGAHPDDIEIGCGGTVLRLVEEMPEIVVRWIVFSSNDRRRVEAQDSAATFLGGVVDKRVDVLGFRDGYFPFQGPELKDYFEALKVEFTPLLILTHFKSDAHQDHRLIAELTHNTFRDHLILEYEIPKYDGDFANPNFYVPLTSRHLDQKVDAIMRHFQSQRRRSWFSEDTFHAMARLRGIGCNAPEGLAEGFFVNKIVF